MTNQPKRIKVKETQQYCGDFDGPLDSIISSLQKELDNGWESRADAEYFNFDYLKLQENHND